MNKKNVFKIGSGASSILMIVITLVLTTFAVLSLASAQADMKLTEKAQSMTTQYYNAENEVQELYAQIDEVLAGGFSREYRNSVLRSLNDTLSIGPGNVVEFSVPVNGQQQIAVRLQINMTNGKRYDVISQKLVNTGNWNPEIDVDTWKQE